MTVQELYDWCKVNNALDLEINVESESDPGYYIDVSEPVIITNVYDKTKRFLGLNL